MSQKMKKLAALISYYMLVPMATSFLKSLPSWTLRLGHISVKALSGLEVPVWAASSEYACHRGQQDSGFDSTSSASIGPSETHWGYPASGYSSYNYSSYPTDYPPLESASHFSSLQDHSSGTGLQQDYSYPCLPMKSEIKGEEGSGATNSSGFTSLGPSSGGQILPAGPTTASAVQHRYDSGYGTSPCQSGYHSGWAGNSYQSYPNHYPATQATQPPYLNPAPSVFYYPASLVSTVNQNQIHLHLHGDKSAESLQYGGEELATIMANSSNLTISSGAKSNIEIGIMHNQSGTMPEDSMERYSSDRQNDPTVWRPY